MDAFPHTPGRADKEAHGQLSAAICVYHEASGDASRPAEPLRTDHEASTNNHRTVHPLRADHEAPGNASHTPHPPTVHHEALGDASHSALVEAPSF